MVDIREISGLIGPRLSRVLTCAEAALPSDQFRAFRKLVLDEFGRNGFEGDLRTYFKEHQSKHNG
jgi:hypothetical protein